MSGFRPRRLSQPGLALMLASTAFPAMAQPYDGRGMWHGSWGWGHMVGGSLLMLLFWGGLITLVVLFVRGLTGRGREDGFPPAPMRSNALDILEERFARGEIGQEEFTERRQALLAARADGRAKAR